jgi:AraC family transcriptional regulator, regulatory protein of adaptative response / methylated-DNA-[protein]-cysteine methyltransferase
MTSYERIEKVIEYMEKHRDEQPRLAALAKVAGLSEHHFHRLFSRWAGTTPKAFLKYLTNAHAKELLRSSRDLLGASLEAGLSGPGRLHDLLVTVEGVTPGEYKARGAGVEIRYGFQPTPFGLALVAVTARGVCHFAFLEAGGREKALNELRKKWPRARIRQDRSASAAVIRRIFGRKRSGKIAVVLRGTPFQLKVWEALLRVPPGKAASYAQVAAAVGRPRATRAVGSAVGRNALAYLIPCHRVLRRTGALGGYRWGSGRKRAMLAWESAH